MKSFVSRAVALALLLLSSGLARAADLPDVVFDGLKGRSILVVNADGTEVAGELLSFDSTSLAVAKPDGRVVVVSRSGIGTVSSGAATPKPLPNPAPTAALAAPVPSAPPAPTEAETRAQIATLRATAQRSRRQAVVAFAAWTPVSATILGVGLAAAPFAYETYEVEATLSCIIVGGLGVIAFPLDGAKKMRAAKRDEAEAVRLEGSLTSNDGFGPAVLGVAPLLTGDAPGLVLAGTF